MTLIWWRNLNSFLANNVNKQRFLILMNERLEAASIKTCHAKCDADVPIGLEVKVTKYAANKATTLLGNYTKTLCRVSIKPRLVRTQDMH